MFKGPRSTSKLHFGLTLLFATVTVFGFTSAAHADDISAGAVPTFVVTPSADTLSFDTANQTVTVPGTFTQNGTWTINDSGFDPDGSPFTHDLTFSFSDTITVNGITQTLVFTGDDNVTQSTDFLTINALGPVNFGDVTLNFAAFSAQSSDLGSNPVVLSADVSSAATPEPSTFALLGTGLLGAVGAARRKLNI